MPVAEWGLRFCCGTGLICQYSFSLDSGSGLTFCVPYLTKSSSINSNNGVFPSHEINERSIRDVSVYVISVKGRDFQSPYSRKLR